MPDRGFADRLSNLRQAVSHFLYGLTGYEFARHAVEMRHELEVGTAMRGLADWTLE